MATCKDCVHVEVCLFYIKHTANLYGAKIDEAYLQNARGDKCKDFQDRARFVELPCKIGDTLYTVVRGYKIREWIVTNICFSDYLPRNVKVITARDKQNSEHMRFAEHYLEKTVFLTREAAEQALKERE